MCGQGVVVRVRREYCSHVNVQSIKIKCELTTNAYKDAIFMRLFRQLVEFET